MFSRNFLFSAKNILIFFLFFFFASCSTLKNNDEIVVTGKTSWPLWYFESKWDLKTFYSYKCDPKDINILKEKIKQDSIGFDIFASSFCDECKIELQKIMRIFQDAYIPLENYAIIGLDHDYKEPGNSQKAYRIKNLPFIAVFKNNKLIGTLTSPQDDWLKSILDLLNK